MGRTECTEPSSLYKGALYFTQCFHTAKICSDWCNRDQVDLKSLAKFTQFGNRLRYPFILFYFSLLYFQDLYLYLMYRIIATYTEAARVLAFHLPLQQ